CRARGRRTRGGSHAPAVDPRESGGDPGARAQHRGHRGTSPMRGGRDLRLRVVSAHGPRQRLLPVRGALRDRVRALFPAPRGVGRAGARDNAPGLWARDRTAQSLTPRTMRPRVRAFTLGERADLEKGVHRLVASIWPPEMEYINHDPVCGRHWGALYRRLAAVPPPPCYAPR